MTTRKRYGWVEEDHGHETLCWIWQGKPNGNGYPSGRYAPHVRAFEEENGPIPKGLELDHLCRVRMCVRPSHLEAVTRAENCRRREAARKLKEAAALEGMLCTVSFADDAEKASRNGYPSRGCAVGAMLRQLDPDLRAEVLNVLRDRPEITAPAIRTALLNQGVDRPPSPYTIQRHRREVCSCESA